MAPTDPGPDGLLLVDKPPDWTSHDVVARGRRLLGTRRVGHAGTLDPMATGLLVLGVNRGTRLLTFLVGADKDYTATIRLGQSTSTDDADGEVLAQPGAGRLCLAGPDAQDMDMTAIDAAVRALSGRIEQVPSAVSAIKVDGQRAYHRVRRGEQVHLAARPVHVASFEVTGARADRSGSVHMLDLDVSVTVSSGTYVRALARDLGQALGVGGHLRALRRTRVGRFSVTEATGLAELEAASASGAVPVVGLADAARRCLRARDLTGDEAVALGYGRRIAAQQPGRQELVAAFASDGTLVAILDESAAQARALAVFAPSSG
ncbi:MAG TPA: tRNA pseudouridine(55) synthase TruB [Dermatophilaceae bacterium]|nr:tRNA pseudouridine(55) synthase TruB [Dermatophilaceae bacterium]